MTRFSDQLRGAVDRAPVSKHSVSVEDATRRIKRQRGMRMGANGVVGAGAAALVTLAIVSQPMLNAASDAATMAGDDSASGEKIGSAAESLGYAPWGLCGSYASDWVQTLDLKPVDITASLTLDGKEAVAGTALDVQVTGTGNYDSTFETGGPVAVVLWDGMVVSVLSDGFTGADGGTLAEGETLNFATQAPLTSCFDGEPLPASKYEVIVRQEFWQPVEDADISDPLPIDLVVSNEGVDEVPNGLPDDSLIVDCDGGDPCSEPAPAPLPETYSYAVISQPVPFVIEGEPVEDPFAQYIPEPWTPPELPENALTPEIAKEMYAAAAKPGIWNMAAGTSRWTLSDNQSWPESGAPAWFYGCGWDGLESPRFPATSAELDLLTTTLTAPASINVRYGWVVDNNPELSLSVTNSSEYALPGFWGQPNSSLYLVKDGRVVAEGWPTNVNRYGNDLVYLEDSAASTDKIQAPLEDSNGLLEPGDSLTGDYIWRDVNGCWTTTDITELRAGTYTLLSAQRLYVENYGAYYGGTDVSLNDGPGAADSSVVRPAVEPTIAYSDEPTTVYESVELTMWTSHGTIVVTTS